MAMASMPMSMDSTAIDDYWTTEELEISLTIHSRTALCAVAICVGASGAINTTRAIFL
jgi:hypothetical protein